MRMRTSCANGVSIPLKSGHRFNASGAAELQAQAICLNPFEIRASVQHREQWANSPTDKRLNPFEIRASVQQIGVVRNPQITGLNPFEIRASVQQIAADL